VVVVIKIIRDKLLDNLKKLRFTRITRKVCDDFEETSRGYVVDLSNDFVVIQETDDFKLLGFNIFPIKQIIKVRYNNHDRYYDKIMDWEKEKDFIGLKTKIDLTSWQSIFKTFQQYGMNIIVECENSEIGTFTIGSVQRVTKDAVYILYFDASGFIDAKPTRVDFKNISKIMYDNRYIDIFSKYLRKRKGKK
jgi:hypothetical protein